MNRQKYNVRPVTQRHERIIVVGGGPSLRGFDYRRLNNIPGVATIAVNEMIFYFDPTYFHTTDRRMAEILLERPLKCYSFFSYAFKQNPMPEEIPINEKWNQLHNLTRNGDWGDLNFRLCEEKDHTLGWDSGYSTLNVAYHMEPKKILLLGLDQKNRMQHAFDKETSEEDPHDISYSGFMPVHKMFDYTIGQLTAKNIQVVNGSLESAIGCFVKKSIEEGLEWIQS